MLIKYTPEKNHLGKPELYYMGRIRLARGVNNAPDAIKDHPSYEMLVKSGAIEEVKSSPIEEEEKPKVARKLKDPVNTNTIL